MLLSVFSFLYELIIGTNNDYPEYRESIFDSVGIVTIIFSLAFTILFYLVLGRWKEIWYTTTHWFITALILSIVSFLFAIYQGRGIVGGTDSYLVIFSIIDALYSVVYFIVFSFLLKRFSIFAKQTPRIK